ncbi:MAG: hypothetical protein KUG78_21930 [Kangiellaceae bacterium]|nr:hypothetical protein [Kangiellaceae bacterium]
MNNQYLIEVLQSQILIVEVEASSSEQAIDFANKQIGAITRIYPPEIEADKTKLLKEYDE